MKSGLDGPFRQVQGLRHLSHAPLQNDSENEYLAVLFTQLDQHSSEQVSFGKPFLFVIDPDNAAMAAALVTR